MGDIHHCHTFFVSRCTNDFGHWRKDLQTKISFQQSQKLMFVILMSINVDLHNYQFYTRHGASASIR